MGYNDHLLSNNTADIENNLFGIGATNLQNQNRIDLIQVLTIEIIVNFLMTFFVMQVI